SLPRSCGRPLTRRKFFGSGMLAILSRSFLESMRDTGTLNWANRSFRSQKRLELRSFVAVATRLGRGPRRAFAERAEAPDRTASGNSTAKAPGFRGNGS